MILHVFVLVSDLYGEIQPPTSKEPPVVPQKIEKSDLKTTYSEAKLYKKVMAKLKGTAIHLIYLGKNDPSYISTNHSLDFISEHSGCMETTHENSKELRASAVDFVFLV